MIRKFGEHPTDGKGLERVSAALKADSELSQTPPTSNPHAQQLRSLAALTPGLIGMGEDLRSAADEIERLARERDVWKRLNDAHIAESNAIATRLGAERDRLRGALTGARDLLAGEFYAEALGELEGALSGEHPPSETAGDWLTNEQCDDVIAFLEDYEWTGLTRENVRTWCTAIAEARSSVKASGEPT